tara:strand:+ start:225 stop:539 length:315 start_codon:yes stop_codon:yes gene_type:complete
MYRIYYTHDGEITTVGVSKDPGTYIECNLEIMEKVQQAPQTFLVKDKKLVSKKYPPKKQAKKLQLVDDPPGWIVAHDNFFEVIEYANEKPLWFDFDKHKWVRYD